MSGSSKMESEGKPPLNKRSMVSEEDLVDNIRKVNRGEKVDTEKIPSEQVLLLFIAEVAHDCRDRLDTLIEIFKGAQIEDKIVKEKDVSVASVSPTGNTTSPIPVSRVDKVIEQFQKYGDMLKIDTEESAQFVIMKTTRRLESSDFTTICNEVRALGGDYVSKGKDSHFKVPKLTVEQPEEAPKTPASNSPVDVIKVAFTTELETLLNFTQEGEKVILKPKQFLGSDNFAKIASVVRNLNGEYISAGRDSHFEVPIPKTA